MGTDRIGEALVTILRDQRAKLFGTPQWAREDDPELYDAINLLRDMIVNERIRSDGDASETFGIGSSYIRHLTSWLAWEREFKMFHRVRQAEEIRALEIVKARVDALIGKAG